MCEFCCFNTAIKTLNWDLPTPKTSGATKDIKVTMASTELSVVEKKQEFTNHSSANCSNYEVNQASIKTVNANLDMYFGPNCCSPEQVK